MSCFQRTTSVCTSEPSCAGELVTTSPPWSPIFLITSRSREDRVQLLVQALDDRLGRLRRGEQAVPLRHVDILDADFGQRGHVLQQGRALLAGDRHGAQLARLDVRHGGEQAREHQLRGAADRVHEARRGPLVGHVNQVDTGGDLEHLAGQVRRGTVARGRVVDRAWLGFRGREQLRHGLERCLGVDDQHRRRFRHQADGFEVLDRVVAQLLQRRVDAVRGDIAPQERVPVGGRARHVLGRDAAVRAGLVVDDDRLAELVGQALADDARHRIVAAAGRGRHDDRDHLARVGIGRLGNGARHRSAVGNANQCGSQDVSHDVSLQESEVSRIAASVPRVSGRAPRAARRALRRCVVPCAPARRGAPAADRAGR